MDTGYDYEVDLILTFRLGLVAGIIQGVVSMAQAYFLVASMLSHYRHRAEKKSPMLQISLLHLLYFSVLALNFIFQYFLKVLPMIFAMMYLTTVGGFIQLKSISKNVMTINDKKYQKQRENFLFLEIMVSIFTLLIGFIPEKGFGSLCSDQMIYPLSFSILLLVKAIDTVFIFLAVDHLQIRDDKLLLYYDIHESLIDEDLISKSSCLSRSV